MREDSASYGSLKLSIFSLRAVCRCCRAPKGSIIPQVTSSQHVQSKPSGMRRRTQLEFSSHEPLDADVVEASQPDVVSDAGQPVKSQRNQAGTKHRQTVPKDPNTVGFVPAYILGNMYLCKTPERQVPGLNLRKHAT